MSVSYEKFRNIIECCNEEFRILSGTEPESMDDSIVRVDNCIFSLSRYNFSDLIFYVIMSFESEKHRFSVCILSIDQTSSIF